MSKLDFTLKIPKRHLSYTQVNTYLNNPKEYYDQYVMGKDFMEELKINNPDLWEKIKLGGIFQEAWYDPRINWRKKIKALGFTPDKIRIIETALAQKNIIRMPRNLCERRYYFDVEGIPFLFITDGFDDGKKFLCENKFGNPRQQEKVDEDLQLSVYCLGIYTLFGWIPKRIVLQSVNDRTGKVNVIETKRAKIDLDHAKDLIIQAARGISLGQWETEYEPSPTE